MRVAVDAMGGDHGPAVVVAGAIAGARTYGVGVALVGRAATVGPLVAAAVTEGLAVEVIDAPDVIEMDERPAQAARRKPNSSISLALRAVKDGRVGAMVSAGNSGAVMAAALLVLGRVPGIERPAIAAFLPSIGEPTLVLDLGAVTDPRPHHLVQFARMAHVYAERVLDKKDPSIGLLSNGEEPTKGNQLVQEVYPLLAAAPDLNFKGNVEGKDVLRGTVDIIVTDGFTGNVALKVAEGVGAFVGEVLRAELTATLPRKIAALALRPAFRAVRARLDPGEIGGAPLLGIAGPVIIAHGRSDEKAIANAVGVARRAAEQDIAAAIGSAIRAPATPAPAPVAAAEPVLDRARD